jgi:hypothetical protein
MLPKHAIQRALDQIGQMLREQSFIFRVQILQRLHQRTHFVVLLLSAFARLPFRAQTSLFITGRITGGVRRFAVPFHRGDIGFFNPLHPDGQHDVKRRHRTPPAPG